MIEPELEDIGRSVIYVPHHGDYSPKHNWTPEHGVISSFNAKYVFVKYGDNPQSQATRRCDLYWEIP